MAKRPVPRTEVVFKFLSVIFFLIVLDIFFIHPVGNIVAVALLLVAFFYMGKSSEK